MTVKELREKLEKFPQDMPVGIYGDFQYPSGENIDVEIRTWVHSNHPYNLPDTDYVNIE